MDGCENSSVARIAASFRPASWPAPLILLSDWTIRLHLSSLQNGWQQKIKSRGRLCRLRDAFGRTKAELLLFSSDTTLPLIVVQTLLLRIQKCGTAVMCIESSRPASCR